MNWRRIWLFGVLIPAFLYWLGVEVTSIAADHGYMAFTLSDTIRDWEVEHHWLKWAVGAVFAGLWVHFFVQRNQGQ